MRWFALPLLGLSACGDSAPSDSGLPQCDDVSIELPSGRGEVQAGWDASQQRLVVFGGNEAEPINCSPGATEFDGATWAWRDACDGFVALDPDDAPSKRGRYAAATDTANGRLLIHGGRFRKGDSGDYTLHGDVWAFDFANDSWSKLAGSAAGATA